MEYTHFMASAEAYPDRSGNQKQAVGYVWAAGGVALATGGFWLVRSYLDKGQASLLYLPVAIACALRFGFGPAVLGAVLSFLCWDFFFLPPFGTFVVTDPKDWLSLFVFLLAAITTAQLASRAREQTQQARAREAEIATLFQASEALSREIGADSLLVALAQRLQVLCRASRCLVFRRASGGLRLVAAGRLGPPPSDAEAETIRRAAEAACEHRQVIGFGTSRTLWAKALVAANTAPSTLGVYVPLQAEAGPVGVLHVGPRTDGQPFSGSDERLILTLANHAAVAIARADLAAQAAQAEALREADALKDSLLSLVSHELRTPLAAIKVSASGLLQPDSSWEEAARQEALRAINREADRLSTVVSNLLDLSRLEAGAWRPHKDWCDLAEVAGTALDRLPPPDAARITLNAAPDLPLIRADYAQIALVLTNLLENALKYTPAGSPIRLGLQPAQMGQDEAPSGVTVRVRDFGAGLTPGEEERLFDRFYRGVRHEGGSIHGTGLGLALCRAIVQAHGGRIWAANAPAGETAGAVFSVFLPKEDAA
ncbi:MAG: DUF4118 domain-containing protein [Armatimonadetes bacterium]|nr:DUF4118 domain-containing protein [Armatimonadota bacterium]